MATRKTPRPTGKAKPGPTDAQGRVAVVLGLGGALVLVMIAVFIATRPTPSQAERRTPPTTSGAPATPAAPPAPAPPRPAPAPAPPRPAPTPPPAPAPEVTEPEVAEPEAPAPTYATAWARGQTERVRVKRCVDGDTFETQDGRKVRLVGINTPEREMPLYGEAKELLRSLVDGQEVTLEWDQERVDKYERNLAYVFKGDMFVNGEVVRQGLAYCYTWEPNVAHRTELITFQREARAASAGLWSLPRPAPEARYLADREGHFFHRPSCANAARIRADRKLEFTSRDEVIDTGQNPCRECKP